jgi:hypothetical protein
MDAAVDAHFNRFTGLDRELRVARRRLDRGPRHCRLNVRGMSKAALEALAREQERELGLLRHRISEMESRAALAEAGSREAWRLARSLMKRG